MDDKEQKFKTYRSLSNMHNFRLRLFAEGILTGILAGIVISSFRFALSEMEYLRGALYNRLWVSDWSINACWFAVLIAIAFILHKLNCIEPMAAGSGIPQVKGAILGLMKMRWLHILWVKLTAGIIGIGAGLSLGREGPSIQLGAVTAQGVSRLMGRTRMEERYLLTSGASAGLAAAFNAPLAGVIFALEELHRNFSIMVLLPSMAAAFTAITAYSFLVFNLLCAPCFAAIGAIKREMNSAKWTWFAIGYQCGFAYVIALMINQFGNLFTGNANILGVIVSVILLAGIIYMLCKPYKEATKLAVK